MRSALMPAGEADDAGDEPVIREGESAATAAVAGEAAVVLVPPELRAGRGGVCRPAAKLTDMAAPPLAALPLLSVPVDGGDTEALDAGVCVTVVAVLTPPPPRDEPR